MSEPTILVLFFGETVQVFKCLRTDAELLFAVADAVWRSEAARALNLNPETMNLSGIPATHGEPDSLLRTAFEARMRAYRAWQGLESDRAVH